MQQVRIDGTVRIVPLSPQDSKRDDGTENFQNSRATGIHLSGNANASRVLVKQKKPFRVIACIVRISTITAQVLWIAHDVPDTQQGVLMNPSSTLK